MGDKYGNGRGHGEFLGLQGYGDNYGDGEGNSFYTKFLQGTGDGPGDHQGNADWLLMVEIGNGDLETETSTNG